MRNALLASVFLFPLLSFSAGAEEPPLPMGLEGGSSPSISVSDEPALPAGLGGVSRDEPSLPSGLKGIGVSEHSDDNGSLDNGSDNGWSNDDWGSDDEHDLPFTGFAELRVGTRLADQNYEKRASIGEARVQLQAEKFWEDVSARITADLVSDLVADRWQLDLDKGDGWLDLREAFVAWRATDFMDIKAGRQILTWGTGDMLFLNDLFPKDYDSFFIGRDTEYLKAPSDAIKASFFTEFANLDVVYTPNFDADRFADGARISTYDPLSGGFTSTSNVLKTNPRGKWFAEDEWALRLYRNFGAYEVALYGYDGYWKNPKGLEGSDMRATFPRLGVYGASVRGPISKGIGNVEIAYYDSRNDRNGIRSALPNDQFRALVGYEQEIAPEFTGGVQYYLERTLDYDNYKANHPAGSPKADKNRQVVTLRLTKMMMNQDLTLSLFNFWSPNDHDGYIRPKVNYKINDQWTAEAGANIFYGKERYTFFGQLEDNTNIYASLRYSF